MRILAVNAGSSSLKLTLLDEQERILTSSRLDEPSEGFDAQQLRGLLQQDFSGCDAVGHRFVHGGHGFTGPRAIDREVVEELGQLAELAPLHQLKCLRAAEITREAFPELPHIGCFDSAFHARMPLGARTYALPEDWRRRFGLRRFGFHGLSHEWIAERCRQLLVADGADLRLVSAHLGAGASLCAIRGGRSLDTTMGFTPAEGLVMATRAGSIDPGMLIWLAAPERLGPAAVSEGLEHRSGLVGLAGSDDMQAVLEQACRGESRAAEAIEVYIHRLCAQVAAMTAALGGIDALAFTGGVGEASAQVRQMCVERLGYLGLDLDSAANAAARADAEIGSAGAAVRTFVIGAREDLMIARQTKAVIQAS